MRSEKIEKNFITRRGRAAFVAVFLLFAAMLAPAAHAEPVDLSGFELISLKDEKKVDLGELSKGLPLYIVFSTST